MLAVPLLCDSLWKRMSNKLTSAQVFVRYEMSEIASRRRKGSNTMVMQQRRQFAAAEQHPSSEFSSW